MSIYDEDQVLRILRYMGPVDLGHFDGRLRLQKLAFLIQEIGGGGRFAYYWYIRGPYSPSLTQMLYSGDEVGAYKDAPELTVAEQGVARKVQALVGDDMDDPLKLELYASVWYLAPERALSDGEKKSVIDRMQHEKPRFAPRDVKAALEKIEKFRGRA